MSKFKVGDTVVVVGPASSHCFGHKYEVKLVTQSIFGAGFLIYEDKYRSNGWHEDALVSAEVFNSPLYHAMKEE